MSLKVNYQNVIAVALLIEAAIGALSLTQLLPLIAFLGPRTWVLVGARAVLTGLQFRSAAFVFGDRDAGRTLARRVLLASALLMVFEVGFRLAPTNLDPTFKWWVVGAYWAYVLAARWVLRARVTAPG